MAQFGAELDILFQKDIVKNVNWKSHLNVFESYTNNNYNTLMPYLYAAQDSMGTISISKKTQYIPTVTWDNDLVFKINKILSATPFNTGSSTSMPLCRSMLIPLAFQRCKRA